MSDDTDESTGPSTGGRSVHDLTADWYPVPVVGLLMAYMLWVRAKSWHNFVHQGQVFFSGNDAWYHYRNVAYVVHNWPYVMPFDPWTQFPFGTSVGQFGTLYDQLIATTAIILGLGHPSTHLVAMTTLFTPPVLGTLAAVPTYLIAKRLAGRPAGVLAVAVLAFLPGTILNRSLVGFADHDVAMVFFQGSAVALFLVAFCVAERDSPVWEQVRNRDWAALRPVLGWSALAGVATAFYMWVWPPGVLLVGILGVFFLLKLSSAHYNGRSPDHLAFVGTTSAVVTGVLMFVPFSTMGFSATNYSLLQPGAAFSIAVASVFLSWLSREYESRDVDRTLYPLTVLGLAVVGSGIVAVVLPSVFHLVFDNFTHFVGFNANAAERTIGEAQPWLSSLPRFGGSRFALFFTQFGLTFFAMLLALAWLLWRPFYDGDDTRKQWFAIVALVVITVVVAFPGVLPAVVGAVNLSPTWSGIVLVGGLLCALVVIGDHDAEKAFIVVWAMFVISAGFTQVRFTNTLAIGVAVLSGYGAAVILRSKYVGIPSSLSDLEATQVVAIAFVILVLIVPLTVPVTLSTPRGNVQSATAAQIGGSASPGAVLDWNPMLQWMRNNTPQEGNFGGTNNANQLPYYGMYHVTNNFSYPNGAYGVMSWWDYGHWITVLGHRIPDANPFQQQATYAANFLLARNETHANQILDSKGSPNEKTRYVAVDWKMDSAGSKFGAPTAFYNDKPNVTQYTFYHPLAQYNAQKQGYQFARYIHTQAYYQTMMTRLYRYQGSAMSPQPIVVDWTQTSGPYYINRGNASATIKQFKTMSAARAYVANHSSTSQIGGVGRYPSDYVPALKHYRLVGLSTQRAPYRQSISGPYFSELPYWAKLYERVPGATVHGTGPANTNVTASVTMYSTQLGRNQNFTYTQRAQTGPNGQFTMTLPYSTTGYDKYGPQNGQTNVSVRAEGPYQFSAFPVSGASNHTVYIGRANVTEGQVNGANSSAVSVALHAFQLGSGSSSSNSSGSSSASSSSSGLSTTGSSGSISTSSSRSSSTWPSRSGSTTNETAAPVVPTLRAPVATSTRAA